jgi:5-methyltetrahydrofolate--homocysteine methyltransferase
MRTVVTSQNKEVVIGDGRPTVMICEVSGGRSEQETQRMLEDNDFNALQTEALSHVESGADIIDLRLNASGPDEVTLLPRAVKAIMDAVDIPLSIHTSNAAALEAALSAYEGKPLINGVSAEPESMGTILPLARRAGAAVIGRAHDSEKSPATSERRVALARAILEQAESLGLAPEDVIIDCLTFSPAVLPLSGLVTVETVRRINAELGLNTLITDKHISYGLPEAGLLDQAFVAVAIGAGVTCLEIDPGKVRSYVLAADVMVGRDSRATRYIRAYRQART